MVRLVGKCMEGTKHAGKNPHDMNKLQIASLHWPFIQSIHFLQESSATLINISWCGLYAQVHPPYTWDNTVLHRVLGRVTPACQGRWRSVHFEGCDFGCPTCPLELPSPHHFQPGHSLPVHYTAFSAGCAAVPALHYVFSYFAWDLYNPLVILQYWSQYCTVLNFNSSTLDESM